MAEWWGRGLVGLGRGRRDEDCLVGEDVESSGPLKLKVEGGWKLMPGVTGADCKPGSAKSGSSGSTIVGMMGSSGVQMVGIGGVKPLLTLICGTL